MSKSVILNGKIEFFTIFTQIDTKSDKKWPKIDHKLVIQNDVKFDYQKGDSGSAGMLGEKCVIVEAPNLDTKSDQNQSSTWKIIKIDQNSSKQKNRKKWKSQKVTKSTKQKNTKTRKSEKQKVKKWKKWHFQKTPKKVKMSDKWAKSTLCDFRAAWSGVFRVLAFVGGPPSPIRNRVLRS